MRDLTLAANFIKKWEGCELKAYLDSAKVPTIGWGTIQYPDGTKVKMGDTITQAQADEYLIFEINQKTNAVDDLVKVHLNDNQYAAVVSFAYNVGAGAFASSTLLKFINQNDYSSAAAEFGRWIHAGGKVIQGLINRRKDEKALFLKPTESDSTTVLPPPLLVSELPSWFAPFKLVIERIFEAVFGKSSAPINHPDETAYQTLVRLNPQINPKILERAVYWWEKAVIPNKKYILAVDFSKNDRETRLYFINTQNYVAESYKVAHGKNSDTNQDGLPDSFSNLSGSYKSSLGAVKIGKQFTNPKWLMVRLLDGLEPLLNGNIRSREILLHTTKYVNDIPGQSIGDTLGCFGVSEPVGKKIIPLVEGCLLYSWDDSLV